MENLNRCLFRVFIQSVAQCWSDYRAMCIRMIFCVNLTILFPFSRLQIYTSCLVFMRQIKITNYRNLYRSMIGRLLNSVHTSSRAHYLYQISSNNWISKRVNECFLNRIVAFDSPFKGIKFKKIILSLTVTFSGSSNVLIALISSL